MDEGNYDIERIGDKLEETNKELVAIKDALRDIAGNIASIAMSGINVDIEKGEE